MAAEIMYKEIRRAGNTLIMDKNELGINVQLAIGQ
jgi:hypothetical protein